MNSRFIGCTCLVLTLAVAPSLANADPQGLPSDPVRLFQQALDQAQTGSVDFQIVLGELFEKGIGTEANIEEAYHWYSEAAKAGHPGAQARLGILYAEGRGVAKDVSLGIGLLKRATDKGEPLAMAWLGLAYVRGDGVPQDRTLGMQMLTQASDKGNGSAAYELAKIHLFGTSGPVDKAEARKWFEISAKLGFPNGQYVYARDYVTDPDERLRLTFLAAHGGQRNAQYDVGQYYLSRSGSPADRDQAVGWFRRAALNGNEMGNQALFKLGLPDVNGNMPVNSTVASTAMPAADDPDDLMALLFAVGISIIVLSAFEGGEPGTASSSADGQLFCNYGEIDMGGYCAPPMCGYGEFNAGGFCMSYPDDWLGGN